MAVPGNRINGYEVIREVGRGGMATVYLARQDALDRDVALKELSSFDAADRSGVDRFLRESQLVGSLNHRNIVTVHQFFEHDGVPYISMEYLARGSLRSYVGTLSFPQLVGVMEGVLAGLTHADHNGVVHRDLKPENLMVTDDGGVKITDFGIAKATVKAGLRTFLTKDGMTVGTPSYMAPEQAVASKDIGPWTDLYSVGIMSYEHLIGAPPFVDSVAPIVLFRHVNEPIPPAAEVDPAIDRQLSDWIDRLLAKNPRERTRSPVTAWEELEEIAVRRVGALWRRQARLPGVSPARETSRPLTPATFESHIAVSPEAGEAPGSRYVTFGPPRAPDAPELGEAAVKQGSLCGEVLTLCRALDRETSSETDAQRGLRQIESDVAEAVEATGHAPVDAARAADALRRIEELPWAPADLRRVRDRIEELQEKGAEMQLIKLARWAARCAQGEISLPTGMHEELKWLLGESSRKQRLGMGCAAGDDDPRRAAHERALAWRCYEGSPAAPPMARRLAADVVRFYEQIATAAGERAA